MPFSIFSLINILVLSCFRSFSPTRQIALMTPEKYHIPCSGCTTVTLFVEDQQLRCIISTHANSLHTSVSTHIKSNTVLQYRSLPTIFTVFLYLHLIVYHYSYFIQLLLILHFNNQFSYARTDFGSIVYHYLCYNLLI